jgi:hypothetical protein
VKRYVVSLTRNVMADSEEEALQKFETDVINGGDWDSESLDVEEDPEIEE